jgi:Rv2632c-like/Domain of unknown function (DUF1918)
MRARPGDRIVIASTTINQAVRDGQVLEARGPDGGPPYLVRWSDGHEGVIYPGVGATIQEAAPDVGASVAPPTASGSVPTRVRDWTVRVSIVESGDDTDAEVVLVSDSPVELTAAGHSHRGRRDDSVPQIGDEVAVARALRHLADQLLATAATDIEAMTGERDVTVKPG